MEYPPHALELIQTALLKGDEFKARHLSDPHEIEVIDVGRKYLAFMSQFGYRWFNIDPTKYELISIEKSNDGVAAKFECKGAGDLPQLIVRVVSSDFGQVLDMAKICSQFIKGPSEGVWKGAAMMREMAVRILPSIAETLQTVVEGESHSSTSGEFERSTDYMTIWIKGQEWTLSEPQSRFLKALESVFPKGAEWKSIKKIAPTFTHDRASDVFKGNPGGSHLRGMIVLEGKTYRLKSKPCIKTVGDTVM